MDNIGRKEHYFTEGHSLLHERYGRVWKSTGETGEECAFYPDMHEFAMENRKAIVDKQRAFWKKIDSSLFRRTVFRREAEKRCCLC